jgi:sialidase-1
MFRFVLYVNIMHLKFHLPKSSYMRPIILSLIWIFLIPQAMGQESFVFEADKEGHAIYRIPAIISLPNTELLAVAEGRVYGSNDYGDINLVMKKSKDKGITLTPLKIIVDHGVYQAGNPAPVVDRFDPKYPEGVIYVFFNTGNHHEYNIRLNEGVREIWYTRSTDMGESWEIPVNITNQVHKVNNPDFNPAYQNPEDWRHYANTPGHAFQFQEGPYKGRIYVAANHSQGPPQEEFTDYQAHGFFTDDHGKTFKLSPSISIPGSNEAIAAELPNGKMIMSVRNQRGDIRQRILAFSNDGGESWEDYYFEPQLPDPVCQGSILDITGRNGKKALAHSNPSDPQNRDNLTLKISWDEGKNWTQSILVDKSNDPSKPSWTAYSDLVQLDEDHLGILYERNNYREIVFKQIKWLEQP